VIAGYRLEEFDRVDRACFPAAAASTGVMTLIWSPDVSFFLLSQPTTIKLS
jgi:hypothetical protein